MEQNKKITEPDNTAVRTALWRAVHIQVDAKTISTRDLEQYYFTGGTDNLLPASGEIFLLART